MPVSLPRPLLAPPHPTAEARGDKAKWVFTWPLIFLLCITIPNCSKPRWEKFFMVTFITATLWIAIFSYLMVWLVSEGNRQTGRTAPAYHLPEVGELGSRVTSPVASYQPH